MSHETIELIFVAVAALALVVQTTVMLAAVLGIAKAAKAIKAEVHDIKSTVMPVVASTRDVIVTTRDLITRLSPKVESTVTDVSTMATSVRKQVLGVQVEVESILSRVHEQSGRVDTMFSHTLDTVDKASTFVATTVSKPMRQISGLLAAMKAIVESFRESDPAYREPTLHDDKDMFV